MPKHRYGVENIVWTNFLAFQWDRRLQHLEINDARCDLASSFPELTRFGDRDRRSEHAAKQGQNHRVVGHDWVCGTGFEKCSQFHKSDWTQWILYHRQPKVVKEQCDCWYEVWTVIARSIMSPQ